MRTARANKIDNNQPVIVGAMRKMGATVQHLNAVGDGCPDLLVGWRSRNYLIEVKNPEYGIKLTDDEGVWHSDWRGDVTVICTIDEAISFLQDRDYDVSGNHTH